MTVYRALGSDIARMRNVLTMSQTDLAQAVGMSRGSIANIETGRQRVLLHDVAKFAAAFGVKPDALLRGVWVPARVRG